MPSHSRFTGRAENKRDKGRLRGRDHGTHAVRGVGSIERLWQDRFTLSSLVSKQPKGTKQLRLDHTIYDAKEKIVVGDVIYIEHQTGAVNVCTLYSKSPCSYSILTRRSAVLGIQTRMLLPMTSNRRHMSHSQKATCTSTKSSCKMSLSAISTMPMRGINQGGQDIMSVMGSLLKSGRTEVTEKLRREVNTARLSRDTSSSVSQGWCPESYLSTRSTCWISNALLI